SSPTATHQGLVVYESSSIVMWNTLAQNFPDYTTLNRDVLMVQHFFNVINNLNELFIR
ncbi:unnamed protein product, partial [Rotaria sp. Silwood1]